MSIELCRNIIEAFPPSQNGSIENLLQTTDLDAGELNTGKLSSLQIEYRLCVYKIYEEDNSCKTGQPSNKTQTN